MLHQSTPLKHLPKGVPAAGSINRGMAAPYILAIRMIKA